jgi:hypothetical protein
MSASPASQRGSARVRQITMAGAIADAAATGALSGYSDRLAMSAARRTIPGGVAAAPRQATAASGIRPAANEREQRQPRRGRRKREQPRASLGRGEQGSQEAEKDEQQRQGEEHQGDPGEHAAAAGRQVRCHRLGGGPWAGYRRGQ